MDERRVIEGTVKDKVKRVLTDNHVHYKMPPANGYGVLGDFDFVCCVKGLFLGIETKRDDKEEPTALQTDNAQSVLAAGGVVLLIHNDNVDLVRTTVLAMQQRRFGVPSYWPEPKVPPPDGIAEPVVRRKEQT